MNRLAFIRGLRPSDSPTRSLARRFTGALRSRGSLRCARSRRAATHVLISEIGSTRSLRGSLPCAQSSNHATDGPVPQPFEHGVVQLIGSRSFADVDLPACVFLI